MAKRLQFKRGTTLQNESYPGLSGEVTVDTDKQTLVVHDGNGNVNPLITEDGFQSIKNKTISLATNTISGLDGDGLEIFSDTLRVDDSVLRTTGAQTIDGSKTFTSQLNVNSTAGIGTDQGSFSFLDENVISITFGASATDISIGSSAGTTTVNNDFYVNGDYYVAGTFTTVEEVNLIVEDKKIYLASTTSPNDSTANTGGIVLLGTTDKSILWTISGNSWNSSENFNLAVGKSYRINGTTVLSGSTLGSNVVDSSLTSVGTLTSGTWNAVTISAEYGGTGYSSYTNGELLIGNTTGNTLSKSTLTADTGISITNGSGSITIGNSDKGSSQNIFKRVIDSNDDDQFSAESNNDAIKFVGSGTTEVTFDSEDKSIIISSAQNIYSAGDGLIINNEDKEFSVDSTVVRTYGDQTITDTKTFSSTISGNIDGNAGSATKLETARTINGVSFDGTSDILIGVGSLEHSLSAGDGLSAPAAYDGSADITFTNADKGSSQAIFKKIQNVDEVDQFSASTNDDSIQFASDGIISVEFDSVNKRITYSLNALDITGEGVYNAGDGLDLTGGEFKVDSTVVRNDSNQTINGTVEAKSFKQTIKNISATTGTTNINFDEAGTFNITLSTNTNFVVSNVANNVGSAGTIVIIQNSIGGNLFTLPSEMKTPIGGLSIAQVTDPNTVSILSYYIQSSTRILVNYIGDFA